MQIAVGGCLAQKDRARSSRRRRGSTSCSAPTTSARCRPCWSGRGSTRRPRSRSWSRSRSSRRRCRRERESAYAAWVSVSVGCNNTCTFCIVPALRGKEKDRRPGDILAEVRALVAEGVSEVTLLGQNVNSYGVEFGERAGVRQAAAGLRRGRGAGAGAVHLAPPGGVHRRRHRRDGRDAERDAAAAHAAAVGLRPGAQGDAAVLPPREATSGSSTASAPPCPTPRSPPTSSSGSPARPRRTSCRPSRSSRPRGSPVPTRSSTPSDPVRRPRRSPTRCRPTSCGDRYERLVELVNDIAWAENKRLVGRTVELMVSEGEGRKDAATHRLSGRGPDNRLVHFDPSPAGFETGASAPSSTNGEIRPGDMVTRRDHPRRPAPPGRRRRRAGGAAYALR